MQGKDEFIGVFIIVYSTPIACPNDTDSQHDVNARTICSWYSYPPSQVQKEVTWSLAYWHIPSFYGAS